MFYQALRYPFQGKDWFRHILILALLQLLPVIGQLMLLGYGMEVVRSLYAGQTSLPRIRWLRTLKDGARFLFAGLLYMIPLLLIIVTVGSTKIGIGNLGIIGILLSVGIPLLIFLLRTAYVRSIASPSVRQPRTRGNNRRFVPTQLLPVLVFILIILTLKAVLFNSGIDFKTLNGYSLLLFAILALLVFLISVGLYVGGVRYAVENKGLLAATTNARPLLKNRAATGMLFLNVFLLYIIAIAATSLGLVLFILPGLFVFVVCSLALWYMFACYYMDVNNHEITNAEKRMETD